LFIANRGVLKKSVTYSAEGARQDGIFCSIVRNGAEKVWDFFSEYDEMEA
jgi:hypothetical protein